MRKEVGDAGLAGLRLLATGVAAVGQPVFVQCQVRSILAREFRRSGESPGQYGDGLSLIRYAARPRTMNHSSRIPMGKPGRAVRNPGVPSSRAGRAPIRCRKDLSAAIVAELPARPLSRSIVALSSG